MVELLVIRPALQTYNDQGISLNVNRLFEVYSNDYDSMMNITTLAIVIAR